MCKKKGKGDLVGCDISVHLLASSNGQGGTNQHNSTGGQDVIVKSSSDVKVRNQFISKKKKVKKKKNGTEQNR